MLVQHFYCNNTLPFTDFCVHTISYTAALFSHPFHQLCLKPWRVRFGWAAAVLAEHQHLKSLKQLEIACCVCVLSICYKIACLAPKSQRCIRWVWAFRLPGEMMMMMMGLNILYAYSKMNRKKTYLANKQYCIVLWSGRIMCKQKVNFRHYASHAVRCAFYWFVAHFTYLRFR